MTSKSTEGTESTESSRSAPRGTARLSGRAVLLGSLGAVVAVAAVLILLLSQVQVSGVSGFEEADGRALFRALDADMARARAVAIASGDGQVTLERADEGSAWRLAESDGYPVRQGAVDALLRSLVDIRAAYVSEDGSPSYAEYGLNAPGSAPESATIVTVRDGAGEPVARAAFGHAFAAPGLPEERGIFVRVADDPRVWLADREISAPTRREAWLDTGILDISGQRVRRLTLSGTGAERIVVARTDEGELRLAEGLPEGAVLEGPWVLDMLSGLFEQVAFNEVRAAASLPAEAGQVRVATVETNEDVVYTVRLLSSGDDPAAGGTTAAPGDIWATFSAAPAEGAEAGAVRRAEQFDARHAGWAYRLPLPVINDLSVAPGELARQGVAR